MKPDSAIEIVQKLRQKGHEAYLVGGCVRDMVMKLEPSDYDIATSAPPQEIMKIFPHTEAIGVQFGVVLVIHRGHPFEVATFRSDEAYVDGRRPTGVVFTDAQTDVLRRDFTINGMLYDPIEKRVIDHVAGQADIQNRVVRAIGDPHKRFAEDKLRILRAVRFAARFDYSIDPPTWDAVCSMASQIGQVSAERINVELQRVLTEGQAARGFHMLEQSGLLRQILPEVQWNGHIDRSLSMIATGAPPDFALGVLLHEIPADAMPGIAARLKLSRSEAQHVESLVASLPRFRQLRNAAMSAMKRFLRLPRFEDHLELVRICAVASGNPPEDHDFVEGLLRNWSEKDIWPPALVSGDDLIALGLAPGPQFKEILTRIEDEQLEGGLSDRQQALDFVHSHYVSRR